MIPLPQHPDEHRSQRPVLLAVDQELRERASLRIRPEVTNPLGPLEVEKREDVEKLGAGFRPAPVAERGTELNGESIAWRTNWLWSASY